MQSHLVLVAGTDDLLEGILEGGTSDEETINVWLLDELISVLVSHGTTVEDTGLVGGLLGDVGLKPGSDALVGLLGLVWGGSNSGTDGPDWLVGDDDLAPVVNLLTDGSELSSVDLVGLSALSLIELLSDASHDLEVVVEGNLDLGGDGVVALTEDVTSLTVSKDNPVKAEVLEHGSTGLSSVSSVAVKGAVLGGELDS